MLPAHLMARMFTKRASCCCNGSIELNWHTTFSDTWKRGSSTYIFTHPPHDIKLKNTPSYRTKTHQNAWRKVGGKNTKRGGDALAFLCFVYRRERTTPFRKVAIGGVTSNISECPTMRKHYKNYWCHPENWLQRESAYSLRIDVARA